MQRLFGLELPISVAQVKQDTNFVELLEQHQWLNQVIGGGGGELRHTAHACSHNVPVGVCVKVGGSVVGM
jgi:hypothetical protein